MTAPKSEYVVTILAAILGILKASVLPDLPQEAFQICIAYIAARTGVKAIQAVRNGNGTKAAPPPVGG